MGSLPPPSVFRGRGHIISRTLTLGSSPIQTNFREVFHPYSISYHLGEVWVEFMTNTGPRISQEATPMVILIRDGVGKEHVGMVTIFCYHNQNKMETCDALFTSCQCDSPEPSVVVVRRYANTPYIPRGTT